MRQPLKLFAAVGLAALTQTLPIAVHAADDVPVEKRVDRIEKELRAVQRKVFPGGAPVEPEITAAPGASLPPSSTPVTDLIARVTSLESQLATLTGQVEQNSYKLRQMEDRLDKMKAELMPAPPQISNGPSGSTATASSSSAAAAPQQPASAAPAAASEARKAAVAAIERPNTGDSAQDSYTYGFRLWDAKFYPEAQVQLKTAVEKYGNSSFGSRAQNLLGRAYLDDGKPALASVAFYENYQKRPEGDRAAQSLTYLGEALIQLNKPADACKVYSELDQRYGPTLTTDLRAMADKGRTRAKCGR